jgi:hypothetical protein
VLWQFSSNSTAAESDVKGLQTLSSSLGKYIGNYLESSPSPYISLIVSGIKVAVIAWDYERMQQLANSMQPILEDAEKKLAPYLVSIHDDNVQALQKWDACNTAAVSFLAGDAAQHNQSQATLFYARKQYYINHMKYEQLLAENLKNTKNDLQSVVEDNKKILTSGSTPLSFCSLLSGLNTVVGDLEDTYNLKNPSKTRSAGAGAAHGGAAGAGGGEAGGNGGNDASGGGNGGGNGTDVCSSTASKQ